MPEYSWQICHCLQDQQLALRWCCMALRDTPWWHQPWQVLHYHTVVFPRQSAWSVPLLGSILRMKVQKNCHKCAIYMEKPWHLFYMKITLFRYNATCISISWVVYPGKIGILSDDDDNENAHLQLPPVWLLVSLNKINSFRPKLHVHVRILIYTILNDMVSPKDLYTNTILLFQDFLKFCQKKWSRIHLKSLGVKHFQKCSMIEVFTVLTGLTLATLQLVELVTEECVWGLVLSPLSQHRTQQTDVLTQESPKNFLFQFQSNKLMFSMTMLRGNLSSQYCSIFLELSSQMMEDLWWKYKTIPTYHTCVNLTGFCWPNGGGQSKAKFGRYM